MQTSTKHPKKKHLQVPIIYQKKRGMRFPYRISILFCLMLGLAVWQEAWATDFTSNGSGSSWSSAATWTRSNITNSNTSPGPGDNVIIQNAHKIILASDALCSTVTIQNTVNADTSRLKLNGYTLSLGSITFNPGNGQRMVRLIFGSGTLKVSGSIAQTGTSSNLQFDYTSGGIEFNGTTAQTLNLTSGIIYPNIHINNASGVKPNAAINTTNIKGNIVVSGGKFDNGDYSIMGNTGKTFEIKNGATFLMTGTTSFPTGFTPVLNTGSTVEYGGGNQTIAALPYSNLKISGTGTKTPDGPITLDRVMSINNGNTLSLANGSITLGNHDLTLQQTAAISNISATNYIKQSGTGKLIRENVGTGGITTEVLFPIGTTTSYTPAYITNTGTADNFSVRVADDVRDNFNTLVTMNVVKKTWHVEQETSNGTANVTLKLQWNDSDEGNPFLRSQAGISHYYNNTWHQPATFVAATTSGTTHYITLSGLDHFSPFGVGDINSPLPVELISFTATKKENAAYLQWVTASEKNNAGFHIQTSADGRNFEDISFVASRNPNSSTTQQYDFLDKTVNTAAVRYYRLKQSDFDGKVSFSDIKAVDFTKQPETPQVYPNPFTSQINFNLQTDKDEELSCLVMDITGKTVYQSTQKVTKGNNAIQINLEKDHPAGLYLLRTQSSSNITSHRLIKQ